MQLKAYSYVMQSKILTAAAKLLFIPMSAPQVGAYNGNDIK